MKKILTLAFVAAAIGAVGFAGCLLIPRGFDPVTVSRLERLSKEGAKNPNRVTDDDLRWVTSLLQNKTLTGRAEQIAFQECARVLVLRRDLPPDLRAAYKNIGIKMVGYRGDAKEHNMVALTGCAVLSRT